MVPSCFDDSNVGFDKVESKNELRFSKCDVNANLGSIVISWTVVILRKP